MKTIILMIFLGLTTVSCKKQSTASTPPTSTPPTSTGAGAASLTVAQDCSSPANTHKVSTDGGATYGACVSNTQSCSLVLSGLKTIGTGSQTFTTSNATWGSCVATSCSAGYNLANGYCTSFNQYITRFLSLATSLKGLNLSTANLSVKYDATLNGTTILGICTRYWGSPALDITLNQIYWEAWDGQGRNSEMEQLLFHELAHCLLLRGHDLTTMPTDLAGISIPATIMNPYHLASRYYEGNYVHYIKELFTVADGINSLVANGVSYFPTNVYTSTMASSYAMKMRDPGVLDDSIENFQCDHQDDVLEYSPAP
jgi:hypothetical protein